MSSFINPDCSIPLLTRYVSKVVPVQKLNITQENTFYRTGSFERIPFYKPISLMYPTQSHEGTISDDSLPIA